MSDESEIEERIDALSDAERGMLISDLAARHPRITKQLLEQVDLYREEAAARESMPQHPLTQHRSIPGAQLCYFRHKGTACLRMAEDPLHATEAEVQPSDQATVTAPGGGIR